MLASVGAYAQYSVGSISLQPKVGVNIANITDADGSDSRIGLATGLEAEFQGTDIFSLIRCYLFSARCKDRYFYR